MNERIKTLFIKAGGGIEEENGNLWTYSEDLDPKEFAKLIVRECAKRVDYWETRQGEHSDDLLKHFGVEE
jgi:hypothetical protein